MNCFVDWVSVSQYHGAGTPEFIGSLAFKDLENPAPVESAGPRSHRGSFDSSLQVKSHGGWVKVSGNPSRFNRPDNLFGLDLDGSMLVINAELQRLGLPAFTIGVPLDKTRTERRAELCLPHAANDDPDGMGNGELLRWTGAAFSRLDLTQNFSAGSELAARLAIRCYQARAAAYLKKSTYGEETAMWHNTRRSVKAYRKGPDMALHCPQSEWIEWANTNGIVRHEVALKSRVLSGTGLRYWGNLNMGTLHRIFHEETSVLRRPDASLDPVALQDVTPNVRMAYAAWLRGEDIRAMCSRSAFYRHRKALQQQARVDIAEPRSSATVTPIVRVIDLVPCAVPVGYSFEQVRHAA